MFVTNKDYRKCSVQWAVALRFITFCVSNTVFFFICRYVPLIFTYPLSICVENFTDITPVTTVSSPEVRDKPLHMHEHAAKEIKRNNVPSN